MTGPRAGAYVLAAAAWALSGAAAAQATSNPYSYTRTSSFTYNPTSGVLLTQTVEPNNLAHCATTTYQYDAYGNKVSSVTANCAGASGAAVFPAHGTSGTYAAVSSQAIVVAGATVTVSVPAGTFASADSTNTQASNPVNVQTESRTYDPRFGSGLTLTGPNGLTTTTTVDDFGRTIKVLSADGTSVVTSYCYLNGSGLDASSNSATCTTIPQPASGEAPADAVMFVDTESYNAAATPAVNAPFTRVYMDRAGHKIRTVRQAFDGAGQTGGTSRLVVQDTDYSPYGVVIATTQPYFLDSGSSSASGSAAYGVTRIDYDVLGRTVAQYVADANGSAAGVAFGYNGDRGTRQAAVTTFAYAVLNTRTTNDLGQTRLEEKDANSQIVRVTDAMGAQLARQFDAFGNLIAVKDALQNISTASYDLSGHKVAMNDPDKGQWTYGYDALGELVSQASARQIAASTATTLGYDGLGRMTRRVDPTDYTTTWTYDAYADGTACTKGIGKLCQVTTTAGLSRKYSFDSLGRPLGTRTDVTNGPSFASGLIYDATNGRVAGQIYPTGLTVSYGYTALGYLQRLQNASVLRISPLPTIAGGTPRSAAATLAASTTLWSGASTDAWGHFVQQADFAQTSGGASSVATTDVYDTLTGRLLTRQGGLGGATTAINLQYAWDSLGRLLQRTDNNGDGQTGAVGDSLQYDAVGRLASDQVAGPALQPGLVRTVNFEYNALGSLLYKSDVGVYSYPSAGSAHPHAVSSVSGTYAAAYLYDADGNASSASAGAWASLTYTSFDQPATLAGPQSASGLPSYAWSYDENHQRFKELRTNTSGTTTTWYLNPGSAGGLAFEREEQTAGIFHRHFLVAGGQTVGVVVTTDPLATLAAGATVPAQLATASVVKLEYWHVDHQGNLLSTTDHAGALTARYAYDPFGKRRYTTGTDDPTNQVKVEWSNTTDNGTSRGYTQHEHLDDVGVINMNGRLYDPMVARFMQGDPLVADAANLQDYDRYTYCVNTPGTCTDPSGYLHIFGHNILPGIFHNRTIMMLASIAVAIELGPESQLWGPGALGQWVSSPLAQSAIAGFGSGMVSSGNIKGALQGAATAAAFYEAGDLINGKMVSGFNPGQGSPFAVLIHGVVGCVTTAAFGGASAAQAR